jgi:hypothetical protein
LYGYKQVARTMPHKIYAKQRLCRVLVLQEGGKEQDEDDDDAWFGLQEKQDGREEEGDVEEVKAGDRKREAAEPEGDSVGRALDKLKSKSKKLKKKR